MLNRSQKFSFITPALASIGLLMAAPVQAQVSCPDEFNLNHIQDNPFPAESDLFGYEVVTNRWKAAISAKQDDDDANGKMNSGTIYVYNTDTGAQTLTINNPYPGNGDHFGDRLAWVGNSIVAGTHYNDRYAIDAGAVYVFSEFTGALQQELYSPTPSAKDFFGFAVAGIGDDRVIVGAHRDDDSGAQNAGAAYIFDINTGALLHTLFSPDADEDDFFGIRVTSVGDKVLVGAHYDDSAASNGGAAYLYDANTGALLHKFVSPSPTADGKFGYAVAAVGDNLLVGAFGDNGSGAAYLFDTSGTLLQSFGNPDGTIGGEFGFSISAMGEDVLIGAPRAGTNGAGVAYIFDGATGNLIETLANPHPDGGGNYGYSVSAAGSHNIVVGSSRDDTTLNNSGFAFFYGGCGSIGGSVYRDDSNDGIRNTIEYGIGGVEVTLSGTDFLGNPVSWTRKTSTNGFYSFGRLQHGDYELTEAQPAQYSDGIDTAGTGNGSVLGNDHLAVALNHGENVVRYNFGELSPLESVCNEPRTKSASFWTSKAAKDFFEDLHGDKKDTTLAQWLAGNYPNLYGESADKDYSAIYKIKDGEVTYKSNDKIRKMIKDLLKEKKGNAPDLEGQILAAAVAVYVTDIDNAGDFASQYGLVVDEAGAAITTYNVEGAGSAFGVADDSFVRLDALLVSANSQAVDGVAYAADGSLRTLSLPVFTGVNDCGSGAGSSNVEMCDNGKPVAITLTYTGDSCANSSTFSKSTCSESGTPPNPAQVNVSDDNGTLFDGTLSIGDALTADARTIGEDTIGKNVVISVSEGGNVVQVLEIHASCSDEIFVGDKLGALSFDSFLGEDEVDGTTPPDDGGNDDGGDDGGNDDGGTPGGDASGGDDLCETYGGKPRGMVFTYTAKACDASSNSQGDKFSCTQSGSMPETVHIVMSAKKEGTAFDGDVSDGESFIMDAGTKSNIDTNTTVSIYDGESIVQELQLHASCSVPLIKGDQFGALTLEDFIPE